MSRTIMLEWMQMGTQTPKRVNNITEGNALQRKTAKRVAEAIRTGENISKGKLLMEGGYSKEVSKRPSQVLQSVGFKVELAKLGLTDEVVVPMLVQDLENNPGKRWLGLSIAGKWLGLERRAEEPTTNNTMINNAVIVVQLPPKQ